MRATGNAIPKCHAPLEAKFGPLLQTLPEAIILVDSAGHIVLASEAAERLFGYSRGELAGKAAETLLPSRLRGTHTFKNSSAGTELFGWRKDHSEFPVEFTHQSFHTGEDAF